MFDKIKKPQIVCTLGTTTDKPEVLEGMVENGMEFARMNTAYATLSEYQQRVDMLRYVAKKKEKKVSVMMDCKGPQLRLLVEGRFNIGNGDRINIGFGTGPVQFNYDFHEYVSRGDDLFIENGTIKTKVLQSQKSHLTLEIYDAGEGNIRQMMGVNVPGKCLHLNELTEKDLAVIAFSVQNNVEYIAQSFVRNSTDVVNFHNAIEECKKELNNPDYNPGIVAKIEDHYGTINLDAIITTSKNEGIDLSIMIARGDLFVEVPPEKLMKYQNNMVTTCQLHNIPVIVATGLLESMQYGLEPTRSEVMDTAYAVMSGADALMLSGETSNGVDPVNAVAMVNKIIKEYR
ncbi:hypothetical protein HN814_03870 [Candidatus Woesearchaeota archaeon]|nr:hypothetical protein [Candidatus Woesearchaeota archaeon]